MGLLILLLFLLKECPCAAPQRAIVSINGIEISVEVANTYIKHRKGLSGRESLPKDEGMLFVFDKPGLYEFWMKEMNFPIDIVWIGEDKRVVFIKENATPESFPELLHPSLPALYVIETNAGFVKEHKISVGDTTEFTLSQ